jgi:hypothetical protein
MDAVDLIVFQIIDKTIRNLKFRCLSEATPYHHNVFTFTLFLPEGRAGVAWEPSNKMMLFLSPQKIKCLSLQLTFTIRTSGHRLGTFTYVLPVKCSILHSPPPHLFLFFICRFGSKGLNCQQTTKHRWTYVALRAISKRLVVA